MRFLLRLSVPLLALYIITFSVGCDDAGTGVGGVTLPPEISLVAGAGLVSGDVDLDLGTPSFVVSIRGRSGDAALSSLLLQENGTTIPFGRLTFRNGLTANNPIAIPGADASQFTYEVEIAGNSGQTGPSTYSFVLTDLDGETDRESITINFTQTAPTVELLIEDGLVSGDATINSFGGVFDVRVNLGAPGATLASLSVLEDGELMDASEVAVGNLDFGAITNPIALVGDEINGTTIRLTIDPEDEDDETRQYTFRATDVNGVTGEASVNLTFEAPPGTPIVFDTSGVFFNSSDSEPTGGLDLDNGTAVSYTSAEAEIQDEGINDRINGQDMENWRAQISGVNGTELRLVDFSLLGDGITFNTVSTTEMIRMAFDMGSVPDGSDDFPPIVGRGDDSNDEIVSQPILGEGMDRPGEVFAVQRDDRYYLVRFDRVNYVGQSNDDNYEVSIKY